MTERLRYKEDTSRPDKILEEPVLMNPSLITVHSSRIANHPKVSMIILNWNGLKDTVECLESLKKITYPNYEVIVVDNGSVGNDVNVLREKFGDYVRVIQNDRNYGFAEGNNIGMRYALEKSKPDYILLLNNDTTVDPEFLNELVKVGESAEDIGIVGPKIYDYYKPSKIRSVGGKINWWKGVVSRVAPNTASEESTTTKAVDFIEGSCLLAKRKMIEKIGLLDPEYFAYSEEADWCVRAKRGGYKLYCALDSRIWHKAAHSYSGNTFKLYYFLRNNILFMRKNADAKHMAIFLPYFFFVSLPLFCFKPFTRNPLGTIVAVTRALAWNFRNGFSKHWSRQHLWKYPS